MTKTIGRRPNSAQSSEVLYMGLAQQLSPFMFLSLSILDRFMGQGQHFSPYIFGPWHFRWPNNFVFSHFNLQQVPHVRWVLLVSFLLVPHISPTRQISISRISETDGTFSKITAKQFLLQPSHSSYHSTAAI